jgi:CRISPR-associated RAMP protein (TIGR02581 family)
MFKYQLNQIDIDVRCALKGPFLIRDGRYKKEKGETKLPNSIFISRNSQEQVEKVARDPQAVLNPRDLQYYVPGSSIRGWLRSHAERIARTRSTDDALLCCNPFDDEQAAGCSKRLQPLPDKLKDKPVYQFACMICKLFGCGGLAARISFSDGKLSNCKIRLVDGIGIDRLTGGVAGGVNFKNQTFENGHFTFRLTLRNFEIWQLGLLAFIFRDLEQGALKLGFGKTKGFGQIEGSLIGGHFTYAHALSENRLAGFPDLMPSLQASYDAIPFNPAACKGGIAAQRPTLASPSSDGWGITHTYTLPDIGKKMVDSEFWTTCARQWLYAVEQKKFRSIQWLNDQINAAAATPAT